MILGNVVITPKQCNNRTTKKNTLVLALFHVSKQKNIGMIKIPRPRYLFISVTPCLRDKMSFLVNVQIQLVRILCKIGIIPIPIRRLKSSELDDLIANGDFQTIETEKIYKGASSYFIAAKKIHKT